MARTSYASSRVVIRERYSWPDGQLNIWTIVVLAIGAIEVGIFAEFIVIQNQMGLPQPWLFPFGVTVGSLTLASVIVQLVLISQRRLLPGVMLLFAFVQLVLYITGIVETAIQLFGAGDVGSNCQLYVVDNPIHGIQVNTLAWLEQSNICNCWYTAFSFWIIGSVFFIWMMVMASQVAQGEYNFSESSATRRG